MTGHKVRLTNSFVNSFENTSGKPVWLYDTDLTGFAVTVSPKGKKSWYVVTFAYGRTFRKKIGPVPRITASEARSLAKSILGQVAEGKDFQRRERAKRLTVGDLWEHWFETHSKPKKRSWKTDEKNYERLIKPKLHNVLLNDLERSDIEKLLSSIQADFGKGPTVKARAILSAMFERAISNGWASANPVRHTYRPTFEPRQRYLKAEEITRFFGAVEQLQRETSRDFIKLAVFTGARRANLCEMEWQELDLNRGVWTIPAAKFKGKRIHTVPLIPQALEILRRRKLQAASGQKWVFPGGGKTGHMVEPKEAMKRVKELAGIEDLRFHDLRRTLGAWQNNSGTPTRLIQGTLGHATIATTAASYSPNEVEPIRNAMKQAVDAMEQMKEDE